MYFNKIQWMWNAVYFELASYMNVIRVAWCIVSSSLFWPASKGGNAARHNWTCINSSYQFKRMIMWFACHPHTPVLCVCNHPLSCVGIHCSCAGHACSQWHWGQACHSSLYHNILYSVTSGIGTTSDFMLIHTMTNPQLSYDYM